MAATARSLRRSKTHRSPAGLHRVRLALLISSAAVLILHFGLRNRHEKLLEIPPSGLLGVRNNTVLLFRRQQHRRTASLQAVDLSTGAERELDRIALTPTLDVVPSMSGDRIVVAVTDDPQRNVLGRRPTLSRVKLTFRRHLLSDHTTQEFEVDGEGPRSAITVSGNYAFWLDARPPRLAMRRERGAPVEFFIPTSRLMAYSFQHRRVHVVAEGLHDRTSLSASDEGIFYFSTMNRMGRGGDLYWVPNDTLIPKSLGPFEGQTLPLRMHGRLYWIENRTDYGMEQAGTVPNRVASLVMTADGSGRDRHVLYRLEPIPGRIRYLLNLTQYKDRLYAHLADATGIRSAVTTPPASLISIDPAHPKEHREVFRLPRNTEPFGIFDNGSYYFVSVSVRENWFDWSMTGLFPVRTFFLCRYRLPEP